MAGKRAEKSEDEFVDDVLKDLPEELRKKLKKRKKGEPVEAWAQKQREEIAEREKIGPFA
ncbi:MAG: hypothetical protein WC792_01665 [Candidatus Micrarchaeia archaeon]